MLIWVAAAMSMFAQLLLASVLTLLARDSTLLCIGLTGTCLTATAAWLVGFAPDPLRAILASFALLACFAVPVSSLLKKSHAALDVGLLRKLRGQEQLWQRQHEFLATMSHELRTPLSGIVGLSRLLAAHAPKGQFARDIGTIERFARQLLGIVDEGLAYLRKEQVPNKQTLPVVHMDLLLRDIHVFSTWLAQQQGTSFSLVKCSPMPDALHFDEQKLRQVMVNLVSNAVKYCERGRIGVAVALERKGDSTQLVWTVHDNGRGMDKAEQRRFLEPFAKSSDSSGLGLGLALVRRMVRQLGGQMTIWSERDKGTQILIRMPVIVGEPAEPIGAAIDPRVSLPPGESVSFASAPVSYPEETHVSRLPSQDVARLDLRVVREYVKFGQVTSIEQWAKSMRRDPDFSHETRQFLIQVALAIANVDLQRVEELLDQAAGPPNVHQP